MRRAPRRASATLLPRIRDELLEVRERLRVDADGVDGDRMSTAAAEVGVKDLLGTLESEADAVRHAQLWFVTWQMTLLAAKAAETLPDWSPQEVRPSPSGILIWERGTGLTARWDGPWLRAPRRGAFGETIRDEVSIDGVVWSGGAEGLIVNGLTWDTRARACAGHGHILTDIAARPVVLNELGRGPGGIRIGALLAATWLLADQPTIGDNRTIRAPRTGVGAPNLPSDITVVDLRTLAGRDGLHEPDHGRPQADPDHRWLVRGHWRNQVCGPGRAGRRLTWVSPYLKGPVDAPIRLTDRVTVWRR